VLVVDDQEHIRAALTGVVEETPGFTVVGWARTGEESLDAVAGLQPDLVLMDVNLPGMDGIEASRLLSARSTRPVVLLLSTYDEDTFDLPGCGAVGYVTKDMFGSDRLRAVWVAATPAP
jgi:DNA-binding NarL/FixJ family response regulator